MKEVEEVEEGREDKKKSKNKKKTIRETSKEKNVVRMNGSRWAICPVPATEDRPY